MNNGCRACTVLQWLLAWNILLMQRYLHDFRQILGNPPEEHYVKIQWYEGRGLKTLFFFFFLVNSTQHVVKQNN